MFEMGYVTLEYSNTSFYAIGTDLNTHLVNHCYLFSIFSYICAMILYVVFFLLHEIIELKHIYSSVCKNAISTNDFNVKSRA